MENKLAPEQMEKLEACKTAEEAKALAEKEGIELTDEQLEAVAGAFMGGVRDGSGACKCPYCGKIFGSKYYLNKHWGSCSKK